MKQATSTLHDHSIAGVRGVSGVTHDGMHVWLVDRYANDLVALDPETGEVVRRLGGLRVTSGLTFDGEHLWGLSHATLLEIDPASGEVLSSTEIPAGGSGIAWAAGALWVGRFAEREVMKIDPRTGSVLATLHTGRLVTGVAWADDALWIGAWERDDESAEQETEVRRLDPTTGATLDALQVEAGFLPSGIHAERDGTFWCGDSARGRVRALRSVDG